jgi:hypothetical protein
MVIAVYIKPFFGNFLHQVSGRFQKFPETRGVACTTRETTATADQCDGLFVLSFGWTHGSVGTIYLTMIALVVMLSKRPFGEKYLA